MNLIVLLVLSVRLFAGPITPATFDSPLPASEVVYHYSDCQGTAIRVYEGPHDFSIGLRWGRPAYTVASDPALNGWTDHEIPYMSETTFVSLDGCTVTGLWRTWWRLPAYLVTTYDPVADAWIPPAMIELKRVYLPLTVR